jgi:pantetheine-phosphate adenylyltransferase
MGGTFDHLHEGHKFLIKTGLNFSKKLVIGIASDEMLKNKEYSSELEPFPIRKENVINFIKSESKLENVEIIELKDRFGPPIHEPEYDGIIVSQETYKTALKINDMRIEKGFKPLLIILIPIIKDKNDLKISSTSIRKDLSNKIF